MIDLTDREKMVSVISWVIAIGEEHKMDRYKIAEILESFRKNLYRKITEEELIVLTKTITEQMSESSKFLELYGNGDIPK